MSATAPYIFMNESICSTMRISLARHILTTMRTERCCVVCEEKKSPPSISDSYSRSHSRQAFLYARSFASYWPLRLFWLFASSTYSKIFTGSDSSLWNLDYIVRKYAMMNILAVIYLKFHRNLNIFVDLIEIKYLHVLN